MENQRKQTLDEIYHDHYKALLVMEVNIRSFSKLNPTEGVGFKNTPMGKVQVTAKDALEAEEKKKESIERILKIIKEMRDETKL